MKKNLKKNWWVITINGVLAVLFGGLALYATDELLKTISMYFGLLVLVGGLLMLLNAFDQKRKEKNYTFTLAQAIIVIIIGILIMIFPWQTIKLFLLFMGVWSLLLGILKIYMAIKLREMKEFRYVLAIGGIIMFAIGFLLLLNPTFVAGLVLKILGAVFVVIGIIHIYFSFVVRNAKLTGDQQE